MDAPDTTMTEIGRGIALSQRGQRRDARQLFAQLWDQIGGEAGDPFHRCALAHSMADVQDDLRQELAWDLRALQAADLVTDERAARAGMSGSAAALYPSLHLNLGECYRKLGEVDLARGYLARGQAAAAALTDDGYGTMVRGALAALAERLAAG